MRLAIDVSDVDPQARTLIDHYHLDHQLDKLREESLELAQAVTKHLEVQKVDSKWDLICEMADVLFVMEQIAYKMGITRSCFDAIIAFKYQRQLNRIKEEERCKETS